MVTTTLLTIIGSTITVISLIGVIISYTAWQKLKIKTTCLHTDNQILTSENTQLTRHMKEQDQTMTDIRKQAFELQGKLAAETTTCQHLNQTLATQKKDIEQAQKKMNLEFAALANRIFDEKRTAFVTENQNRLDGVLKPFNDKLMEFKKTVTDSYQHEATQRATLQGELNQLFALNQTMAKEAKQLTQALKGSKTQGNWGELILETLLEKSGLQKGREFVMQAGLKTADGKQQYPDVLLNLPDNRHMIIDAKVSLTAYERYYSTDDEETKTQALQAHVVSVRTHMKQLSQKNYPALSAINSPDFVLMFLPIEPAFGLALQHDNQLFHESLDQHIVMVSPSTLLATLQIISTLWKQDRYNTFSREIAQQGGALYDKFVAFLTDMDKLGHQLKLTANTHDTIMTKLSTGKGNLIGRAEKIRTLGAKTSKQIPAHLITSS